MLHEIVDTRSELINNHNSHIANNSVRLSGQNHLQVNNSVTLSTDHSMSFRQTEVSSAYTGGASSFMNLSKNIEVVVDSKKYKKILHGVTGYAKPG